MKKDTNTERKQTGIGGEPLVGTAIREDDMVLARGLGAIMRSLDDLESDPRFAKAVSFEPVTRMKRQVRALDALMAIHSMRMQRLERERDQWRDGVMPDTDTESARDALLADKNRFKARATMLNAAHDKLRVEYAMLEREHQVILAHPLWKRLLGIKPKRSACYLQE